MEKSYYSTDDEIAWGRLTLEEIKRELQREPRNIKGRETDFGTSTFFTPSTTFTEEKVGDKINNSSGTSAYFTPDESLAQAVGQKGVFLEKLSQAIEGDKFDKDASHDKILPECNEAKNSLIEILDLDDHDGTRILEKFQQTLVENTMQFSPGFADNCVDSDTDASCNESYSRDDIITISDDSSNSLVEEIYHEDSSIHVKEENNVTPEKSITLDDTEFSSPDEQDDLITKEMHQMVLSDISESGEHHGKKYDENECNLSDNDEIKLQRMGDLSPTNTDLSNASNSGLFNDTLEEIEMALKQGLNYEMPSDKKSSPVSFSSEASSIQNFIKPQTTKKLKATPSKYDYIQSPVADYIKKSPMHDNFKTPARPPKSKAVTSNVKLPLSQGKQFKNITSPIGVYIKNGPQVCFKQNIPVKTVPSLQQAPAADLFKNKQENLALPEVIYKPGKKVITCEKKDVVLPLSIQKMVSEPAISKHESRVARPINQSAINRKLLDGNLTSVDASMLNQSEDISFVEVKQAFIK